MRYGICTGAEQAGPMKAWGYDYLELAVGSVYNLSQSEIKEKKQRLADAGLRSEVFNCLFPGTLALVGEKADRDEIAEYLKRAFSKIAEFEPEVVVFGSGQSRRCPEGYAYERAYKELTEVCRMICKEAEPYQIQIAIEPLRRQETNIICSIAEGEVLRMNTGCANARLLADYYHMIEAGDSLEDIKNIGRFAHIHIAARDTRKYPLEPGNDCFDVLFSNLKSIGYDGRISIEGSAEDFERDGAAAVKFLRSLENGVG